GQPQWLDLGDGAEINADVTTLRKASRSPRTTDGSEAGMLLYQKVAQPILQLLGNTRQLFLSPDGDLNLIPFGALVDEHDRYLLETSFITYLTIGRYLLSLQGHAG